MDQTISHSREAFFNLLNLSNSFFLSLSPFMLVYLYIQVKLIFDLYNRVITGPDD